MGSPIQIEQRRSLRWAWPAAGLLALVAFVASLVVGSWLFPDLSVNNDEAVYVLQAETIGSGHLTLSDSLHGDAFRPWMSGRVGDDRLVLVEQPLLPVLMAATDQVFGTMRVALGLVAAGAVLSIFALARELLRDDRVALVAGACFVLSPLVLVQSAMFVSYVLAMSLAAATLTLLTRALDRREAGRPWTGWMLGAGLVHGTLLITRPLEGLVLGFVELAWFGFHRVGLRDLARSIGLLVAGAVPVLLLGLLYNALTTGHPLTFALWTIGGDDSFGFGPRAIADHAQYVDVGPSEAWLALRVNLRAFPHWMVGGLVSLAVGAWGAVTLWRSSRRALGLLATMLVAYPFAYFFYYGNYLIIGGRNLYGPHYYLALLIPTTILLGVGLVELWRRRAVGIAVVLLMVLGTAIEVPDKVRRNLTVRDDVAAEVDAVADTVQRPAVVIIPRGVDGPYVLHPRGALSNPPDLDAPVLFAADLGGRNLELFDRFPDRALYRLQTVQGPDGTGPQVEELQVATGTDLALEVTTSSAPGEADTVAYVEVDDDRVPCHVDPGAGPLRLVFGGPSVTVEGCVGGPVELPTDAAGSTATIGLTDPDAGDGGDTIEARWWFRPTADGAQVVVPGDLWERSAARPGFHVTDPGLLPWITTEVDDPR